METRSKDNGPKVNEYNGHVVFGLNLAKAFILEELKKVRDVPFEPPTAGGEMVARLDRFTQQLTGEQQ